jgi:hypothetical protein
MLENRQGNLRKPMINFDLITPPKARPAILVVLIVEGVTSKRMANGDGSLKPRCEASCRGLHGTGVETSQCC